MNWIKISDKLPEDFDNTTDELECLVYTNYGNRITHRQHIIDSRAIMSDDGCLEKKVVDKGWIWEIEIGNSIKINPIFVSHWMFIDKIEDGN